MSDASEVNRKLKIQLGVCKRLSKEVLYYEKEAIDNEKRIQKMKDDEKDIYDIRKQEEVLGESYMMIPDSKNRLETAVFELANLITTVSDISGVDQTMLEEAKTIVANS